MFIFMCKTRIKSSFFQIFFGFGDIAWVISDPIVLNKENNENIQIIIYIVDKCDCNCHYEAKRGF